MTDEERSDREQRMHQVASEKGLIVETKRRLASHVRNQIVYKVTRVDTGEIIHERTDATDYTQSLEEVETLLSIEPDQ